MAFNVFATPFEKMSKENQEAMVDELTEINAALSDSSHPYFAAIVNISDKINELVKINKTIKNTIIDGPAAGDGLKAAELQALGITVEMFGKGLTMIVDAVKAYSTVDNKVFDSLIDGITKMAESFKKSEKSFEFFMKIPKLLGMLALGIIGLGIGLIIALPLYIIALPAIPIIVLVLGIFFELFNILASKNVRKTITVAAHNLHRLALGIALFGLAIALIGPLYLLGAVFIIPIVFTILLFVGIMFFLSAIDKNVKEGVYTLWLIGVSIVIFGLALYFWQKLAPSWDDIFQTFVVIGLFAGVMYILGKQGKNVLFGAIALIIASVALIILGYGLKSVLDGIDRDWEQMAMVGATVAMIGVEFGLMGIPVVAGFIMLGALAGITASIALITIGYGLKKFKQTGWKPEDGELIKSALRGIRNAFLGLDGDEGFLGMVAAIGKSTMLAAAMVPISLMYIPAAASLLLIGASLKSFKKIGFKENDADNMKYAITSVAQAFIEPFRNLGLADMFYLNLGIGTLSNAGSTLADLASGIQSWSNLTAPVWEYDKKSGQMKIKKLVKLSNSDFINVGKNIKSVLTAITGPLSDVGKAEKGESTEDKIYGAIFGGDYISTGIESLSGIGNIMTGLARGIQDWSNLTLTTYDVVNGKLKIKSRTSMSTGDIKTAAKNMSDVALVVANVFSKIGSDDWGDIDSDYVEDGIDSLSGISKVMTGLALGVQSFANMEFISQKVMINKKTGLPELVPDKIIKLTPSILNTATKNIFDVAISMASVFSKIGSDDWGDIDSDDVEDGIDALSGIQEVIAGLALGIQSFARMEFVQNEIKMVNGVPTIVPKAVIQLTSKDIALASKNIQKATKLSAAALALTGIFIKDNKHALDISIDYVPKISETLITATESLIKIREIVGTDAEFLLISEGIKGFINATIDPFGVPEIIDKMSYFTLFTKNIETLSKSANEFKGIAESFESISKSMGVFKDEINDLDIEILSETKSLFQAMGIVAEAGSVQEIIKKFGGSIEETFKKLADLLKRFANTVETSNTQTANSIKNITNSNTDNKNATENKLQQDKSTEKLSEGINEMLDSLESIDSQLRSGIKTKQVMF